MKNPNRVTSLAKACLLGLFMATPFVANPAYAEKPAWAGNSDHSAREDRKPQPGDDKKRQEKKGKHHQSSTDQSSTRTSRDAPRISINAYFTDKERTYTRNYYHEEFKRGHCPPGLAKKNNGCLPPGQAKQWHIGSPLPSTVVYYPVPNEVVLHLRPPPSGHRYVQVASDILLLAVGTSMVVDAIENLSQ